MADTTWKMNGVIHPLGIGTSQGWNDIANILYMVHEYKITLVIELGIEQGGLAAILMARAMINTNFRYTGWEFYAHKVDARTALLNNPNAKIVIGDIFAEESIRSISSEIRENKGRVLVYCDNGNKPLEVKTFAPFLRCGDIIVAHDYTVEITDKDIDLPVSFSRIIGTQIDSTAQIAYMKVG